MLLLNGFQISIVKFECDGVIEQVSILAISALEEAQYLIFKNLKSEPPDISNISVKIKNKPMRVFMLIKA